MPEKKNESLVIEGQELQVDSDSGWTPPSKEIDFWIDFEFINRLLDATLRRKQDRKFARRMFPIYVGQMGVFHPVGDGGQLHPKTLEIIRMQLADARTSRARRTARWGSHQRQVGRIIRAFFRCGLLREDAEGRLWFGRRYEAWTTTSADVHPTEVN